MLQMPADMSRGGGTAEETPGESVWREGLKGRDGGGGDGLGLLG